MEFVGPEAKVRMGRRAAEAAVVRVPSFWVRKRGQVRLRARIAFSNPHIVRWAKLRMDALRMDAFSRSRRPTWPTVRVN